MTRSEGTSPSRLLLAHVNPLSLIKTTTQRGQQSDDDKTIDLKFARIDSRAKENIAFFLLQLSSLLLLNCSMLMVVELRKKAPALGLFD